jgi:hypothetical protein
LRLFQPTKKLNLISGDNLSRQRGFHYAGTKLSSNLQSQKRREPTLSSCDYGSPASGGVNKVAIEKTPSTGKSDFFWENVIFLAAPALGPQRSARADGDIPVSICANLRNLRTI